MTRAGCLMLLVLALTGCSTLAFDEAPETAELPAGLMNEPERYVLVTLRNEPGPVPARAGSSWRGYHGSAAYTVSAEARSRARALARTHGLQEVAAWPIPSLRVHCVVFELPRDAAREDVLANLAREPGVQLAQPLQTFASAGSTRAYNDPYVDLQRGLHQMAIPAAHRWSRGRGVRIAVIDTGIDVHHPDLAGRVRAIRNFIDRDAARFESDRHGTEVAGVIAALADNSLGIVGVAPEVEILALKACWQLDPAADAAVCNSLTLAQGLQAAITGRAQVINLSVVGPLDPLLAQLIAEASRRGVIVVGAASAGSDARSGFPSHAAGVIAVDVARPHARAPHYLYAPGDDVFTLTPAGGYGFASGSSLATAHVSGVVALLLSRHPGLDGTRMRELLALATQQFPTPRGEVASINACAALAAMLQERSCPQAVVGATR